MDHKFLKPSTFHNQQVDDEDLDWSDDLDDDEDAKEMEKQGILFEGLKRNLGRW